MAQQDLHLAVAVSHAPRCDLGARDRLLEDDDAWYEPDSLGKLKRVELLAPSNAVTFVTSSSSAVSLSRSSWLVDLLIFAGTQAPNASSGLRLKPISRSYWALTGF
jgi:hypothetical protein